MSCIPEPLNHILSFCLFGLFEHQTFRGGIMSQECRKAQANWPLTGGLWRPHLCSNNRNTQFPFWLNVRLITTTIRSAAPNLLRIYHLLACFLWERTVNVSQANRLYGRIRLKRQKSLISPSLTWEMFQPCCTFVLFLKHCDPHGEMSADMTVSDSYMWGGCSYKCALYWS